MQFINMKFLGLVLVIATTVLAKHEQYQGWKSYYVGPSTRQQVKKFHVIADKYNLDVISHPVIKRDGLVLVKPENQNDFTNDMDNLGISYKIHSNDVKATLDRDDQKVLNKKADSMLRNGTKQFPYDNYQELEVIYEYLQDIANRHPNLVTLVSPENSFRGHPLNYLKISTTNFTDDSKPVIMIDATIHAREWIVVPTITWAIHKLVEDVTEPDLLERFDWIIVPVVNPDGYKHSHDVDRFWRKTRSTTSIPFCVGADGNRNYDFEWNTVGTSNFPCSDIFAGRQAFSEVETRVVRDLLHEHLNRIALYLTVHSYGSYILYPWGHNSSLSDNALNLHLVGVAMAQAIDKKSLPTFPNYIVGNSALTLWYEAAGDSEDYAHSIGVPLAYTVELPGLIPDLEELEGFEGFDLDPIYIEQVIDETWDGFVVGARMAGDLFKGKNN